MQSLLQITGIVGVIVLIIVILIRTRKEKPDEKIRELELQISRLRDESSENAVVLRTVKQENEDLKVEKRTAENQKNQFFTEKQTAEKILEQQRQELAEMKSKETARDKELERRLAELDKAREALKKEQSRVEDEEKARVEAELENRNRVWSDFEKNAVSHMKGICTKTDLLIPHFSNTSLPAEWDTSLKPDFVVDILNQYVIFDAKTKNKDSSNLNSYIKTQVASTVRKVKSSGMDIFKTIFLVVPAIGLEDIKETYYLENGYFVFIISLEAFEPIVRILKKLEDYELADKYDPQERENIISLIAGFNSHIRQQNATNLIMTARGLQVINDTDSIPQDVWESIEERTRKIKSEAVTKKKLDGLVHNPEKQIEEISRLVRAKSEIDKDEIEDAVKVVSSVE